MDEGVTGTHVSFLYLFPSDLSSFHVLHWSGVARTYTYFSQLRQYARCASDKYWKRITHRGNPDTCLSGLTVHLIPEPLDVVH